MKRMQLKMKPGEFNSSVPVMHLVPGGRFAYLWVGNDAPADKRCFAHVSGAKTLRRFAEAILAEIPDKP